MSWGNLLNVLGPEQRNELITTATHIDPPTRAPLSAEAAAVEATVAAHQRTVPQNMFASFSIGAKQGAGQLATTPDPLLHWGNVDTGAVVNLVYSGVVAAFPELARYRHPFHHVVQGVG